MRCVVITVLHTLNNLIVVILGQSKKIVASYFIDSFVVKENRCIKNYHEKSRFPAT